MQTQHDGNLNQSEKIPLHSLFGSNANKRWRRYCCSQRQPSLQYICLCSYLTEKINVYLDSLNFNDIASSVLTCTSPSECTVQMGKDSAEPRPPLLCCLPNKEQLLLPSRDKHFCNKKEINMELLLRLKFFLNLQDGG